MIAVQRKT